MPVCLTFQLFTLLTEESCNELLEVCATKSWRLIVLRMSWRGGNRELGLVSTAELDVRETLKRFCSQTVSVIDKQIEVKVE